MEERPPLDASFADLTPDQLRGTLLTLAEHQPGLADVIEAQVIARRARTMFEQALAGAPGKGEGCQGTCVDSTNETGYNWVVA